MTDTAEKLTDDDEYALAVARQFTPDYLPQHRAKLQIAVRDAIERGRGQRYADATHGFDTPESLADWLESLHECTPCGAVGNRKWEPAQIAAQAVRAYAADHASVRPWTEGEKANFKAASELVLERERIADRAKGAVTDEMATVVLAAWDRAPAQMDRVAAMRAALESLPMLGVAEVTFASPKTRKEAEALLTVAIMQVRHFNRLLTSAFAAAPKPEVFNG